MYPLTRSTSRFRFFGTSGPSFALDFVNGTNALDPRVTFTRASTATFFNSAGVLTSAATNAPRFDYNPSTLAAQGFLVEESRTNSIRNNTMQGAVAGTPGTLPTNWVTFTTLTGITRTVVGTGTENGINYIDIRLNGTPSAAGNYSIQADANNAAAALNGQTWTGSSYCKLVAGTTTGITVINNTMTEWSAAIAFLAGSGTAITLTGTLQRVANTRTLNQATTAFVSNYYDIILTGAAIDITLRIGLPQLELGAFATSVIPTTTTALTRSADVASVNTLSPWYNATEGTLYSESLVPFVDAGRFPSAFELTDGTFNNRISQGYAPTPLANNAQVAMYVIAAGVTQAEYYPTVARAIPNKIATAYAANNFAAVINGGVVGTDVSGVVPVVNQALLGRVTGAVLINGYLRRITYYPRKLSSAELQAITA